MKEGLRQSMAWLHTWTGLVVGWVLFFVFVTGTAGYFQYEITRWMQPEREPVAPIAVDVDATLHQTDLALNRLEQLAPVAAQWRISLPYESLTARAWQELSIRWEEMPKPGHEHGAGGSERLDPVTGSVLPRGPEPRATTGGRGLYRMHYALHYMPYEWAIWIVGVCTMLMLVAIVSGVITHKKIFKDFFTFRPGKGQRSWLDAHNAVSVMALPFFLMITYSGLVFFLFTYMPAGREALYGSGQEASKAFYDELLARDEKHAAIKRPTADVSALVRQAHEAWGPGQIASIVIERHEGGPPELVIARVPNTELDFRSVPRLHFHAETGAPLPEEPRVGGSARLTQSVMLNLHEGLFVGIWGRWLYLVAGLLGCVMIATGLVLWTVKRRRHHLASGREDLEQAGVRLVEVLNVATIAGLSLAVAAYFWANRLLPVGMAERADWEFHALFAVWAGALFFALARPLARAWIELLWATCAAYALIPVLNALTTDRHLGQALAAGDWVFAGFELTMLGLAALFAIMALKVQKRLKPGRPAPSSRRGVATAAVPAGAAPAAKLSGAAKTGGTAEGTA